MQFVACRISSRRDELTAASRQYEILLPTTYQPARHPCGLHTHRSQTPLLASWAPSRSKMLSGITARALDLRLRDRSFNSRLGRYE